MCPASIATLTEPLPSGRRPRAMHRGQAGNGFRLVMNAGADAGQTMHYIHLHIWPAAHWPGPPG
jgi:diadenosine tetraphosphate (Ap4A) HIT family hydrolase